MKRTQKLKIVADILMTAALLLMPFEMVGGAAHEWIGMGMFLLYYYPSYSEPEMDREYRERKIFPVSGCADCAGNTDLTLYDRIHGQRRYFVPACIQVPGYQRAERSGKDDPYDQLLLGIYVDVSASWPALGSRDRHSREKVQEALCGAEAGSAAVRSCDCRIRILCVYKTKSVKLHVPEDAFCIFDFTEPLIFFLLDYAAVMGFFVFAGHYLRKGMIRAKSRENRGK